MSTTSNAAAPTPSPEALDAIEDIASILSALAPADAVGVIGAVVMRYGGALTMARTLAFTRAAKNAVTEVDAKVTEFIRHYVKDQEGVYDGYTLTYHAGRRKIDWGVLETYPEAYDAAVSIGAPFPTLKATAKL